MNYYLTIIVVFFAFLILAKLNGSRFGDRISHIGNAPIWLYMLFGLPGQYFELFAVSYIVIYCVVSSLIDFMQRGNTSAKREVDCGQTS
jgi:hypothetical protein